MPYHLSVQVGRGRASDEGTTVDQGALRALQDRQAARRDADHLQEPAPQSATGLRAGGGDYGTSGGGGSAPGKEGRERGGGNLRAPAGHGAGGSAPGHRRARA